MAIGTEDGMRVSDHLTSILFPRNFRLSEGLKGRNESEARAIDRC